MNTAERAKKRARVRHFAGQGLTSPAIAVKVGVSESTVRRWRAENAHTPVTGSVTAADASADALAVPLNAALRGHLAVITETGLDTPGAVELALRFLAFALDDAWINGVTPRGVIPLMSVRSRPAEALATEATS